ncbi:lysylphosphatidylglycerol synthase domain-containing protein [Solitalea lacus]|uniref:lysylphosphatidylglycerol synthase domain-containing protein n=1 Tax=Solitalea lacus TaxID=2911172 RepID=UPI001EDC4CDF|nr:lysylphosphatidylglycerol synthase domain-containing protein [Solitalea lacus]UKJ08471.1 flippase-like domain-containing protein [Solitalea lacus]
MPVSRKILGISLKVLILILTCWFVYSKITNPESIKKIDAFTNQALDGRVISYFLLVIYLAYLNILVETLKWHYLVKKVESLSWKRTVESLLAGLTLAAFTPSRIGEFGGRVLYLTPENRVRGALAMGVGAFSQMMVTNVMGAIGLAIFVAIFVPVSKVILGSIIFAAILFSIGMLLLLLNIKWFYVILDSFSFLHKFKKNFRVLLRYDKSELLTVFGMSFLRYLIFSMQYYLLINLFIPQVTYPICMVLISVIYMVQSILPTFAFFDIGIRGAAATYFFGFLVGDAEAVNVLAAAFGVWLLNLIIPSLLGVYFVLKANFFGATTD